MESNCNETKIFIGLFDSFDEIKSQESYIFSQDVLTSLKLI